MKSFKAALKRRNLSLVAEEGFQQNDTDFVSQLLKIKEKNPDFLAVIGYLREQGIILRQAHELGIKATRLATASATAAIKDIVPKEALIGVHIITSLQGASESPKYEWFKRKLSKEVTIVVTPRPMTPHLFCPNKAAMQKTILNTGIMAMVGIVPTSLRKKSQLV